MPPVEAGQQFGRPENHICSTVPPERDIDWYAGDAWETFGRGKWLGRATGHNGEWMLTSTALAPGPCFRPLAPDPCFLLFFLLAGRKRFPSITGWDIGRRLPLPARTAGRGRSRFKRRDESFKDVERELEMGSAVAVKIFSSYRVPVWFRSVALNLGLIMAGSIIFVLGLQTVLVPQGLLSGGATGIAIIIHYLTGRIGIGAAYFLVNIPLILLGLLQVGRRFMYYSIFGMAFLSLAASLIHPAPIPIRDPMLAALCAGIICGLGGGVILRSLGSAGGFDILSVFLNKRFGLRIGLVASAGNALVLLAGAYLFGLEKTLYSIIYVYSSSRVIDAVLSGFNQRKVVFIISARSRDISQGILSRINRGVTFLKGEGAYSGVDREVVFTVTTMTELPKIKELVFEIDPGAFVVVNETLEVLGNRHGSRRVY